jgi:hypothetical protein
MFLYTIVMFMQHSFEGKPPMLLLRFRNIQTRQKRTTVPSRGFLDQAYFESSLLRISTLTNPSKTQQEWSFSEPEASRPAGRIMYQNK